MNRARDITFEKGWVSGGIRLYPYQGGFGVSISFWPCIRRPEVSIYLGPLKFWLGISGKQIFAWMIKFLRRSTGR